VRKSLYHLIIFLLIIPIFSFAQSESGTSYAFLNLPFNAREIALGGNFQSIRDNDIGLSLGNPSLISPAMNNQIQFNIVDYFAGINYGSASYGKEIQKLGSFVASIQFIDYGKFDYADETGVRQGEFSANDYALNIGWSRALDSTFYIGANLKGLYSAYETYHSFGLAVDVAATYVLPTRKISASIIFRNVGTQIKTYTPNIREKLPFEIQAAFSKSLAHLPLRISILFTNLQKWDISYSSVFDQQNTAFANTETTSQPSKTDAFSDKLMRHIVLGAELNPLKSLSLRIGYNYLKRKEMTIPTRLSTVGFSWGFGLNIYKFRINYARNTQYLSSSPNYLSISTNLDQLVGK
jgi:hypothetical protein